MDITSKHRFKQKDLVMSIFKLFSEEYERGSFGSIWEIVLPLEKVITILKEKYSVSYKSGHWVWVQLSRYEEELGVKLFKKVATNKNSKKFSISIHYPFVNFFQKQHLYISEKLKVANGTFDKIQAFKQKLNSAKPISIFLGAGTLCYHLSTIFAERSWQKNARYSIHTNNLGALSILTAPGINFDNINVLVPEGYVDQITNTIVGESNEIFSTTEFDFIIQGTSCVYNGDLFIESKKEVIRKAKVLKEARGEKILVLTKHEFSDRPIKGSEAYGNIKDYDFIIVPKKRVDSPIKKKCESIFEEYKESLIPEIINWNYEIYKVVSQTTGLRP